MRCSSKDIMRLKIIRCFLFENVKWVAVVGWVVCDRMQEGVLYISPNAVNEICQLLEMNGKMFQKMELILLLFNFELDTYKIAVEDLIFRF